MRPVKERFAHCVLRLIQCKYAYGRVTCLCSLLHLRSGELHALYFDGWDPNHQLR